MQTDTTRKLREDLSPEAREKAERIGSVSDQFKSAHYSPARYSEKFIPSREQH